MAYIGTLRPGEFHAAASSAGFWLKSLPLVELLQWQESFASCAIEGNRCAELCGETLRRWMVGESVSDRYLLGLVWVMRAEALQGGGDGS